MSTADPGSRRSVFDDLHRNTADPWDFATSPYESAKRAATIAALPSRTFPMILEIGCSTGYLSQALCQKGVQVLALDVSPVAVSQAASRVGDSAPITFRHAEIPDDWPRGEFDLIVFSEVLYFMTVEEIGLCSKLAHKCLVSNGYCLLVNWTGNSNLPISGQEAVSTFFSSNLWQCDLMRNEASYILHRLRSI